MLEFFKSVVQRCKAKPNNLRCFREKCFNSGTVILCMLSRLFVHSFIYLCICLLSPAGVFCAIVSHPADTVVSKLNNDVGSTPIQAARELGMKGRNS